MARIQVRRGTSSQWTIANPTLSSGEIGFETDTGRFKIGNGTGNWAALQYKDQNWTHYATSWTTPPTFVETITGGSVYSYVQGASTRYRFVPNPYDANEDAFYSSFSSPTLSGLLATRG